MIQTTPSFNIDTVGGAAAVPATVESIAKDSVFVKTETIEKIERNESVDNNGSNLSLTLSIVAIVLGLVIGYLLYKLMSFGKSALIKLKDDIKILENENSTIKDQIRNLENALRGKSLEVSEISLKLNGLHNKVQSSDISNRAEKSNAVPEPSISNPKKNIELFYANLQSPDQNGVLRFAVRGFVSQRTSHKMFVVEIDNSIGKGSYKINPEAIPMIKSDMQLFNSFVKQYNFSGNLDKAGISTKKPGVIIKSGQFWIVEELLEISIK